MSKVERKLVLGENKMNRYIRDSRKKAAAERKQIVSRYCGSSFECAD